MGSIFWNDTHDRHPSFHSMAKDKKVRKKDKWAFFILLLIGWGLSMLDLPHITGPITWLEILFRPLGKFMES